MPGSFECNCNAGFFGDGRLCIGNIQFSSYYQVILMFYLSYSSFSDDANQVHGPCNEHTDNCTCFNSSTSASPLCGCLQGYKVQTGDQVCQGL